MERPPEQLGGRCPNKGQKGRPKGKGKSKSVGPGKGRGKQENPNRGRSSGSRPPTSRRITTVREEEEGGESQSHTSAHHTAFHDRRGRILPQVRLPRRHSGSTKKTLLVSTKESRNIGRRPLDPGPVGRILNTIVFSILTRNTITL